MLKFDSSRPAPFGFVTEGFCETIGRTPLLRLRKLSEATGCEIWGKAEFLNPGGSVKDRAALGIVLDAEASGALEPGGTIVEGTAGNTGIGLALCYKIATNHHGEIFARSREGDGAAFHIILPLSR